MMRHRWFMPKVISDFIKPYILNITIILILLLIVFFLNELASLLNIDKEFLNSDILTNVKTISTPILLALLIASFSKELADQISNKYRNKIDNSEGLKALYKLNERLGTYDKRYHLIANSILSDPESYERYKDDITTLEQILIQTSPDHQDGKIPILNHGRYDISINLADELKHPIYNADIRNKFTLEFQSEKYSSSPYPWTRVAQVLSYGIDPNTLNLAQAVNHADTTSMGGNDLSELLRRLIRPWLVMPFDTYQHTSTLRKKARFDACFPLASTRIIDELIENKNISVADLRAIEWIMSIDLPTLKKPFGQGNDANVGSEPGIDRKIAAGLGVLNENVKGVMIFWLSNDSSGTSNYFYIPFYNMYNGSGRMTSQADSLIKDAVNLGGGHLEKDLYTLITDLGRPDVLGGYVPDFYPRGEGLRNDKSEMKSHFWDDIDQIREEASVDFSTVRVISGWEYALPGKIPHFEFPVGAFTRFFGIGATCGDGLSLDRRLPIELYGFPNSANGIVSENAKLAWLHADHVTSGAAAKPGAQDDNEKILLTPNDYFVVRCIHGEEG